MFSPLSDKLKNYVLEQKISNMLKYIQIRKKVFVYTTETNRHANETFQGIQA